MVWHCCSGCDMVLDRRRDSASVSGVVAVGGTFCWGEARPL